MPPGGDGYYYFSVYLTVNALDYAYFDIQVNGETICTALGDANDSTFADGDHATCQAVTFITEGEKLFDRINDQDFCFCLFHCTIVYGISGDTVQVVLRDSDDTTPVFASLIYYVNAFTGFRI